MTCQNINIPIEMKGIKIHCLDATFLPKLIAQGYSGVRNRKVRT